MSILTKLLIKIGINKLLFRTIDPDIDDVGSLKRADVKMHEKLSSFIPVRKRHRLLWKNW